MKIFCKTILLLAASACMLQKIYASTGDNVSVYRSHNIHGFTVKVSPAAEKGQDYANAFRFLGKALDYFYKILPDSLSAEIRKYPIYVTAEERRPVVESIGSSKRKNSEERIVINDIERFYELSSTDLGAPLIGAFAKTRYRHLSDAERKEIAKTFRTSRPLYKKTPARKSEADYFSLLTTAYFSTNRIEPSDYHALMEHDPEGFRLMEHFWGERPLKHFVRLNIESFRVMYPIKYQNDTATIKAVEKMKKDLAHITRMVREKFVNLFRRKIIWMDNNSQGAACYHDNVQWLIDNGHMRDKSKCIEINNMDHYVKWSEMNQPLMVFHEFAHMYHFSSYNDTDSISEAYKHAMEKRLYEHVALFNGKDTVFQKAYATTNQYEYFAELSEGYFGGNDFFPFTPHELEEHDPDAYTLLKHIWDSSNFKE